MHLTTDTSQQSHFAQVPTISHTRNAFSLARKHVTTMQFDNLFPMFCRYVYPGDTMSASFEYMARLQTQIQVLHDDLYVDCHAWFVPMRLIQTNWSRFQFNEQTTGPSQDNTALTTPKIDLSVLGAGGFVSKSLYDYLGFPTKINLSANTQHINNYAARAYNLIWNENYRDQNLQNTVTVDLGDGPDNPSNYVLLPRGARHDMFKSALPFQQKGTAISIPLGTSAPVLTNNTNITFTVPTGPTNATMTTNATPNTVGINGNTTTGQVVRFGNQSGLYADLSTATAATINQLRQSFAIQQLLEADARSGTRDIESIQSRWGVTVPDFRLQRPEYLGGSTSTFDGHLVPQSSATGVTGSTTPQANLVQFSQNRSALNINHSFVEHGVVMILVSARSNMTYQQGLPRELSYRTRYDWHQPEFSNLGEVAIKNKEIYMDGSANDDLTFGFQEYGYELRYMNNLVTSEMRSNYATTLDSQHMAFNFTSLPTLSAGFIQSFTPISRNIAVSSAVADPIRLNTLVVGKMARTLPMFSIPGLMRL